MLQSRLMRIKQNLVRFQSEQLRKLMSLSLCEFLSISGFWNAPSIIIEGRGELVSYFCFKLLLNHSAMVADPSDPESAFAFASFLDRTGDKTGAEVFYARAIELDPNFIDAYKGK